MWYVIQTVTGQEELAVELIKKQISHEKYDECFVMKREWLKKNGNLYERQCQVMFPGYIFVIMKSSKDFYYALKDVPKLTVLLHNDEGYFLTISKAEENFLRSIQDKKHIVTLSKVSLDEKKQIVNADGIVGKYRDKIIRQRISKRYVWIEHELIGKRRKILFGIQLEGD